MKDKQNVTAGTQALLALEDAKPDVLWDAISGSATPLWQQLRMEFSMAMAETELNSIAVPTRVTKGRVASRLLRSHLPSKKDATRFLQEHDVLFLVGGMTLYASEGATHNWLIDDFALSLQRRPAVAQRLPLTGRPPVIAETRTLDLAEGRVDLLAKLRPSSDSSKREIDSLVFEFSRLLDMDIPRDRVSAISTLAQYQESRRPHLQREYERMLDRVRPRVVVMEDASYGTRAPFISLIKRRGIRVVEPQHGWIGPSHAAYNYGDAGFSEQFRAGLPDVLMTFGEFWSSSIRYPGQQVAIGKPQIDAMARDVPPYTSRPNQVVVISSVADPEETAEFILRLRDSLPQDWQILFRPHPSERPHFRDRYPALVDAQRVSLDENSDVYQSLRQSRGVVGVASTVLYEALAMDCHVFVRDSRFAKYYVSDIFGELIRDSSSITRMARVLADGNPPILSPAELHAIWKPDAVANFASQFAELQG